jgi:hypothetical protein
MVCPAFPLTLSGNVWDWFERLPSGSINKFEDLGREFLMQFRAARTRKKPLGYLLTLHSTVMRLLRN